MNEFRSKRQFIPKHTATKKPINYRHENYKDLLTLSQNAHCNLCRIRPDSSRADLMFAHKIGLCARVFFSCCSLSKSHFLSLNVMTIFVHKTRKKNKTAEKEFPNSVFDNGSHFALALTWVALCILSVVL